MAASSESKRLLITALVIAVVGSVVLVALWFVLAWVRHDYVQQGIMNANEAAALATLENIQAQEQSFRETGGQYATFRQLADAGVIQAPTSGDTLVSGGYKFTLKVTPKSDAQGPTYTVNADPERAGGRDATGRRHFFISSEVTGVRVNEDRPATASDKPRLTVDEY
jgi:Tfp pilus assembly protein PilE